MTQQLLVKSTTAAWYLSESINQLLYSTGLISGGTWAASNLTIAGGETDPESGSDGYLLTATDSDATYLQSIALTGGQLNRVISLYIKRVSGTGNVQLTVDGTTWTTVSINASFGRKELSGVVGNGEISVGVKIETSGDSIVVAFAQYEDGLTATTYVENQATRYLISQIVDIDYPVNTVRGCAFLDGRFFVMTPDGEVYQSGLEDASTWSSLEFVKSQSDPGRGVYITKIQNYIVTLKEWSTEFFYDAANPTGSILSPVQNAAVQIGCAADGSVQEINGSIAWMGQTRVGFGRAIYVMQGTQPVKISTPAIEKILDSDDLSTVHSWSATVGSHTLYGITLVSSSVTLVYDVASQFWSKWSYLQVSGSKTEITGIDATGVVTSADHGYVDGDIVHINSTTSDFNGWHVVTDATSGTYKIQAEGTAFSGAGWAQRYTEGIFPVVSSVRCNGRQYMQDISSGALYELSQSAYTDAVGAIAMRVRTPRADDGSSNNKTIASLELIGDKVDSVALVRHSNDDYATSSNFRAVDLGANRSRLRRMGKTNRRSFEVLHVKDALVRLEAIEIGE